MPHGNKKSSTTNNKKKKAHRSHNSKDVNRGTDGTSSGNISSSSSSIPTTTPSTTNNRTGHNNTRPIPNRNDFPDWSCSAPFASSSSSSSSSNTSTPSFSAPKSNQLSTIYQRYKQATERFKDTLLQLVPSVSTMTSNNSYTVQSLLEAVDYLREQTERNEANLILQSSSEHNLLQMMDDLKTAISFRQKVTRSYYRSNYHTKNNSNDDSNSSSYDGDEGHYYFVQVLNYCWITLKPIVRQYMDNRKKGTSSQTHPKKNKDDNDLDPLHNRFSALSVDDVLDDSDTIDTTPTSSTDTTTPVRPVLPTTKEYTLHDLTHGDDYFCAWMFLLSLEEMMQFVALMYNTMKKSWRSHTQRGLPSDTFVENVMEAVVYVNFSLQQIMMMEEELQATYPYLNTIYRMMVFMKYPGWIKEFTDSIIGSVSDPTKFLASRDVIAFMGDIVECGFRNPSDGYSDTHPIVAKFCSKWKLNAHILRPSVELWKVIGKFEAPLRPERTLNKESFGLMTALGLQSHSWLAPFTYIGGRDRCMMNTIRMLQGLSNVVKKGKPLILKRGFFGRQWDEARKKATRINEDMDELLMGDLLPTLLSMCTDGLLSMTLPRESELLTFFTVLKSFTKSPEKAVPWSLAFAVHALLTSFFEMQGHNDIEKLGRMAKSSWDTYMNQIHSLVVQSNDDIQAKHWRTNLNQIHSLRWLVCPVHNQGALIEDRAVWNPLCAGLFMQYICFFGNLDGGMAMIDSFAQLRIVLHLFNAFSQLGIIPTGELPFLDWLYDTFKDCKAVWEGPIPKQGEFVKRWWISYGASIKNAQQLANATHTRLQRSTGSTNSSSTKIQAPTRLTYRDMTPINPEDIAACFRRVCLHDFAGIEDRYHTDSQRQRNEASVVYELAVRCNATMDTMEDEQRLLASNFIVIGSKLNEFVVKLFDVLKWTSQIDQIIAETPDSIKAGRRANGTSVHPNSWEASDTNLRRFVMVTVLAEQLLGPLDLLPPFDATSDFRPDQSLFTAAAFMTYLNQISPKDVLFFTPTAYDDDDE